MAAPDIVFRADPAERLDHERKPLQGQGGWRVALVAAGLLYTALIGLALLDELLWPAAPTQIQEIPVEIVVAPPAEPPPPPEPPSPPQPQPETKPLDEKPAFDAPRQSNNDSKDSETQDDSRKAAPPEAVKSPTPSPEPAKPQEAAKEDSSQPQPAAAATPDGSPETAPDGEMSAQKPNPSEQHAETEVPKDAHAADSANFPTFDSVPDLDAGSFAKPAPIAGGKAKATYLSIIYGMIMARVHFPNTPRPAGVSRLEGTIVFSVDSMGGLIERSIIRSSGSHALDAAAYEAVGKAAPFPKPPNGAPIGLRFTYGAN